MNNHSPHSSDLTSTGPLVSVGIPTYNRPEGLRRTLECITGQTYRNLEIIISDNCSQGDQTRTVAADFIKNDSRIRYYRQEMNMGPTFNFQFVLGQATGEYFMWAADDDEWDSIWIKKSLEEFFKNSSLSLCYSEALKRNTDGTTEILYSDITTTGMQRLTGIKKVLLNQYRNIEFYGLIKTRIARDYHFANSFGEDQIFIIYLSLRGEIGKTIPALFINGPGFGGTSAKNTVQSLSLNRMNIYFGYIFLFFNTLWMLYSHDFGLTAWEKMKVTVFVFQKSISRRYLLAVGFGIRMLLTDTLNVIRRETFKRVL